MSIFHDWWLGRKEVYYVVVQPTDIETPVDEAAADVFRALSMDFAPIHASQPRIDLREGRDILATTDFQRGPHEIAIEKYGISTGLVATMPDERVIYDALFTLTERTPVVNITGIDKKTFSAASPCGLAAGDVINVPLEDGATECEPGVVASVTEASAVDTVVLEWDLAFIPETGSDIPGSVQMEPREVLTATKFLGLVKATPTGIERISGCCPTDFTFAVARDAHAKISLGLSGRHHWGAGVTELKGAILLGATSMTLDNPQMIFGVNTAHPIFMYVEDEKVTVTAVNNTTGVCVIDAVTAGHADESVVKFWLDEPDYTDYHGDEIAGVLGTFRIGDDGAAFDISEANFTTAENYTPQEVYGDDELTTYVAAADREPVITATLKGYVNDFQAIAWGVTRTTQKVLMSAGKFAGKTVAVYCPKVLVEPPAITGAPNEVVTIPFGSMNVTGSGDGDNSFRVAFL